MGRCDPQRILKNGEASSNYRPIGRNLYGQSEPDFAANSRLRPGATTGGAGP
jgi:hypothetical protein